MADKTDELVYQLKVTLRDSEPPIWRRFVVPGNITLYRLHMILQSVMGWTNSHLYRFDIEGTEYSIPDPIEDDFNELHLEDSRRNRLNKVVHNEQSSFTYEYDFGDGWEHDILVEKIFPPDPERVYPVCSAGKRACPPEDCGGIRGYNSLLEIISDPKNKEYDSMMEWLGGVFDPDGFDVNQINRALWKYRK